MIHIYAATCTCCPLTMKYDEGRKREIHTKRLYTVKLSDGLVSASPKTHPDDQPDLTSPLLDKPFQLFKITGFDTTFLQQ